MSNKQTAYILQPSDHRKKFSFYLIPTWFTDPVSNISCLNKNINNILTMNQVYCFMLTYSTDCFVLPLLSYIILLYEMNLGLFWSSFQEKLIFQFLPAWFNQNWWQYLKTFYSNFSKLLWDFLWKLIHPKENSLNIW